MGPPGRRSRLSSHLSEAQVSQQIVRVASSRRAHDDGVDGAERWFDRLARGLWNGVRRVSGAGTHRYRRFGYLPPSLGGIAGVAGWDGTLGIHRRVPPFLKRLFEERGRGWSDADLVEAVSMLGTLIHEAFHHVVPRGADVEADWRVYGTFLGEALEEGVTEAATQRMLPHVVKGMERSVPGLMRGLRSREGVYWNYVPAVKEIVTRIQALPGMRGRDVLMELARESPASKLATLTRLYLEGADLDRTFSAPGREECCRRMGEALRKLFEAPETRAWAEPPDRRDPSHLNSADPIGRSRILGMRAVVELEWAWFLASELEGLPMADNWRVLMAKRAVEAARAAVEWSEEREDETHEAQRAAKVWRDQAIQDVDVAQRNAPPRDPVQPPAIERRTTRWIEHWRRSRPGRWPRLSQAVPRSHAELGRG